jgi:hypothetical protein
MIEVPKCVKIGIYHGPPLPLPSPIAMTTAEPIAIRGKHVSRTPRADRQPAHRQVPKKSRSSRSTAPSQRAAAKGQRTLVHLGLPQELVDDVDTLLWMRVTAADKSMEAIRLGKHQIYDEAVEHFLERYENRPCEALRVRQPAHGWRTLWVSSPLVKRCRGVAEREQVSVGRVLAFALKDFLTSVSPAWREFRREAGGRASALLAGKTKR